MPRLRKATPRFNSIIFRAYSCLRKATQEFLLACFVVLLSAIYRAHLATGIQGPVLLLSCFVVLISVIYGAHLATGIQGPVLLLLSCFVVLHSVIYRIAKKLYIEDPHSIKPDIGDKEGTIAEKLYEGYRHSIKPDIEDKEGIIAEKLYEGYRHSIKPDMEDKEGIIAEKLYRGYLHSIRQDNEDKEGIIGGSTPIPKIQQSIKDFFNGKEPNRGEKSDEAVAFGAVVQADILSCETTDTENDVMDVVPLTLGVESDDGIMSPMINRNSVIPTKVSALFRTANDYQTSIPFLVYEGGRLMVKDNHFLGKFELTGIRPAPRGVPRIEVTFEVDADGILKVSALDKETGKSADITITKDKRLSQNDIARNIREAEEQAEEDRKQRNCIRVKYFKEYLRYIKQVIEDKEKELDGDSRTILIDSFTKGESWLLSNPDADGEDIDKKQNEIEAVCERVFLLELQ